MLLLNMSCEKRSTGELIENEKIIFRVSDWNWRAQSIVKGGKVVYHTIKVDIDLSKIKNKKLRLI